MPYGDPDITDPMTLNAVALEVDDPACVRNMAECFVEEYVRLGFDAPRIVELFRGAEYAGPGLAYRTLGEPAILQLIELEFLRRGRCIATAAWPPPPGIIALPVLQHHPQGELA